MRRKKFLLLGMFSGIVLGTGALLVSSASPCKGVEERIKKHTGVSEDFSVVVKRKSTSFTPHCEVLVRAGKRLVPVYVFPEFVLIGEKMVEGKSVSREMVEGYRETFKRELLSTLSKLRYVSYKPRQVREGRYFYFISDPECPFCNSIKEKVKELADRYGWEVRLVWYPLPFHEGARPKAISFLCKSKTYEDYLKNDFGKEECEEGRREVEKSLEDLSFFVEGTPTFVFPDGKVIEGADEKALEEALKK